MALCSEQGFSLFLTSCILQRGAALIMQEQWEEGIALVRQGLEVYAASATEITMPFYLAWLAAGYGGVGQVDEGLAAIAEALRLVDKNDERIYEAEVYRLRGELTLAQSSVQSLASRVHEAEACFLKAIAVAQKQQAKSLELHAATSLVPSAAITQPVFCRGPIHRTQKGLDKSSPYKGAHEVRPDTGTGGVFMARCTKVGSSAGKLQSPSSPLKKKQASSNSTSSEEVGGSERQELASRASAVVKTKGRVSFTPQERGIIRKALGPGSISWSDLKLAAAFLQAKDSSGG
jgi:tetratricopeptide (TPR) repeat protein